MGKAKAVKLCVYLIKDSYTDSKDIVKKCSSLLSYPIKLSTEHQLFIKPSKPNPPHWLKLFTKHLSVLPQVINSSTSAVLLLSADERIFAFTFGYGRALINMDTVEDSFGLRIALNSIDADKMRSVDLLNLDTVLRHTRVQASQVGSIENFDINMDSDILNAVTGISNDGSLGKKLSGAVSINLSLPLKVEDFEELCKKLYEKYNNTSYKDKFPWVDQISAIKNQKLRNELDAKLLESIKKKEFNDNESIFLAVPEIINWEEFKGFKYNENDDKIIDDISIKDVLPTDNKLKDLEIGWFKRKEIYCVNSSDIVSSNWSIYKCINYEVKQDKETYLLTNGNWFKIESSFVDTINNDLLKIHEYDSFVLPKCGDKSEGAYNQMVYDENMDKCYLMDKKMIVHGGGRSKIEFCDLFVNKKDIIHVKKFRGSSCLSHLFSQGFNSAFLLLSDKEFRKKVNSNLPVDWKINEDAIDPTKHEIVYAIISKSKKRIQDALPFFSKISLLQSYKQLNAYRYKVSLAKIAVS